MANKAGNLKDRCIIIYIFCLYKILNEPQKIVLGVRVSAHLTLAGLGDVVRATAIIAYSFLRKFARNIVRNVIKNP